MNCLNGYVFGLVSTTKEWIELVDDIGLWVFFSTYNFFLGCSSLSPFGFFIFVWCLYNHWGFRIAIGCLKLTYRKSFLWNRTILSLNWLIPCHQFIIWLSNSRNEIWDLRVIVMKELDVWDHWKGILLKVIEGHSILGFLNLYYYSQYNLLFKHQIFRIVLQSGKKRIIFFQPIFFLWANRSNIINKSFAFWLWKNPFSIREITSEKQNDILDKRR